jgi:hypothetical protein
MRLPPLAIRSTALAAAALSLAACRDRSSDERAPASAAPPAAASPSAAPASDASGSFGDAKMTITTTDGNVSMSLLDDAIAYHLSDRLLAKVHTDMDTSTARDTSGIGGFIARTVKSAVGSALSTQMKIPLADIEDIRYEDGAIRMTMRNRKHFDPDDVNVDKRPLLESFSPDDARRFVDAVRRAKGM